LVKLNRRNAVIRYIGIQARPLGWGPLRAPIQGDGLVCLLLKLIAANILPIPTTYLEDIVLQFNCDVGFSGFLRVLRLLNQFQCRRFNFRLNLLLNSIQISFVINHWVKELTLDNCNAQEETKEPHHGFFGLVQQFVEMI